MPNSNCSEVFRVVSEMVKGVGLVIGGGSVVYGGGFEVIRRLRRSEPPRVNALDRMRQDREQESDDSGGLTGGGLRAAA